jgi:hypothetical protein
MRNTIYFSVFIFAMSALGSPVSAYVIAMSGSGKEIKWEVPSASYLLNTSGGPSGSLESIQAAMRTWSDVPTSSFEFVYGGTTTSSSHGNNDGQNIVTFDHMGSNGTLAENVYWYDVVTGQILDSDIRINTSYSWSASGSPGDYDVQNIATHELGHSLSLDDLYDVADAEKTMYGFASAGETKKRTLDPDDMAGIARLYPERGTIGDFDGDSKADVAIYRATTGQWWIWRSIDNTAASIAWGSPTDNVVPGDYDGDGRTDAAIWRPSTGQWWIRSSLDNAVISIPWGSPSDIPVPGDYDGDGKTDAAIWRPTTGQWWIQGSLDNAVLSIAWGSPADTPVPGDYDGDGRTDAAVWRPSTGVWWIRRSSDSAVISIPWGSPTDIPVPGDYDGDGMTDAAVWRPSSGVWWIRRSSDSAVLSIPWGSPSDIPVPGDYDGDGMTDAAIWRPSTGDWWIQRSSDGLTIQVPWGSSSDVPVKNGY